MLFDLINAGFREKAIQQLFLIFDIGYWNLNLHLHLHLDFDI